MSDLYDSDSVNEEKQALARALYSQKPIMVLDDPFSQLDMRTRAKILDNVLGPQGQCRNLGTTIVLTTSSG
jgi:ATP-binding cassette, subfamily C (CFTR/MRP), member 1